MICHDQLFFPVAPRKDFDHAKYDELFKVVEKEILQLRVVLQSIEARERERTWLRGKVIGEFLGATWVFIP